MGSSCGNYAVSRPIGEGGGGEGGLLFVQLFLFCEGLLSFVIYSMHNVIVVLVKYAGLHYRSKSRPIRVRKGGGELSFVFASLLPSTR